MREIHVSLEIATIVDGIRIKHHESQIPLEHVFFIYLERSASVKL